MWAWLPPFVEINSSLGIESEPKKTKTIKKATTWRNLASSVYFSNASHFDRLTNHRFFRLSEKHNLSGLTYWACIPDFSFKARVSYGALLFDFLAFQQLNWPASFRLYRTRIPYIFPDLREPDFNECTSCTFEQGTNFNLSHSKNQYLFRLPNPRVFSKKKRN